jgi:hypothetical protein
MHDFLGLSQLGCGAAVGREMGPTSRTVNKIQSM